MNKNELRENTIDEILKHSVPVAEQFMIDELSGDVKKGHSFSDDFNNKMDLLLKREKNMMRNRTVLKIGKQLAACFVVLLIGTAITILSVEALRVKFLNFMLETFPTHTEIKFSEVQEQSNKFETEEVALNYIPSEFKLEMSDLNDQDVTLYFVNENKEFTFTMEKITAAIAIDTENSQVKKFKINDMEAFYSKNSNVNILVWHDAEFSYTITGNIDEKELVKIAENVKKQNK